MADISDAVCWIKEGHWARRRGWDEGNYVYAQDGKIYAHAPGAAAKSEILATGEDLLADDWELPTDLRVSADQMRRGEGTAVRPVIRARTRAEEIVGRELTWADEQPPEGSVVRDNAGGFWYNTGSPMGNGEMQPGGANWQQDHGHGYTDDRWGDPETWAHVCQWQPVTVIEWGY